MPATIEINLSNVLKFRISKLGQCNRIADLFLNNYNNYDFELSSILTPEEIEYVNFESIYMSNGEFEGKEKVKSPSKLLPIIDKITNTILLDSRNSYNAESTDWQQSQYRQYLFDLHYLGEISTLLKTARLLNTNVEIVIWFE